MTPIRGRCLCGSIRYSLMQTPDNYQFCYCDTCRRAHASAFSVGTTIASQNFVLDQGQELLSYFESSPGKRRYFCRHCGTHLYAWRPAQPEALRLRIATLDTPPPMHFAGHLYAEEQPQWYRQATAGATD